jgi:hypothetical protein
MPVYSFHNPENESEIVDVVMSMNDKHEYIKDGISWCRIWCKPQASIDTKWDAFSNQQFVERTKNMKGNVGDLFDKSKELSMERERIVGKDTIKEQRMNQWSKERGGKKYFDKDSVKAVEI